jgi:hypothetical protein
MSSGVHVRFTGGRMDGVRALRGIERLLRLP